ncbi:hypothetical protein N5C66_03730 [Rhizobium pusense]|uniref:Uncharacterized protein n=1 Tax=Agrobacterium genomosp. 2 str. CFBP 5494 TaxID=1183436 RepID=A0A9W5EYE6_9HYPH|nr:MULTISPECIES: hypothetical protein [Rhizobium/Agrobacterium group]MDH0908428.1 hypothetical protein [Agrobacterium pusense]MDH1094260.1 hypothetical protein [Agrobacterium pusense]MDH1110842.1 hypothetical protein [Agrobacterium pusense]MDH2192154.1 hypothetical protein [Agrobacterium pusense]CAD7043505.1 hypothetical protein RP007_01032 [Rhizobium sp. P007]
MYDINQPIFTYAGALRPATKKNRTGIILAVCAGLLLAALAI